MTTTDHTPATDPYAGCGPDCALIDGTCRCHHGEPITEPTLAWLRDLRPCF